MNIQKAMIQARKRDEAICRSSWPVGHYIYHGMDNLMRDSNGHVFRWSAALLLATDYETTKKTGYHGPMFPPIRFGNSKTPLTSDDYEKMAKYKKMKINHLSDIYCEEDVRFFLKHTDDEIVDQ